MDDFMGVQVAHAIGYLLRPIHEQYRGQVLPIPENLVELTVGAILHDDAVAWGLNAHTPGMKSGGGCGWK